MNHSGSIDVLGQRLGADRVIAPRGALPQPAERLDASAPVRPYELELAVERLCLDSTSHARIRENAGADPERMAARILEIVGTRGKMHNPETDSGGDARRHGPRGRRAVRSPPAPGASIVTLASLTLTPLRLDAVDARRPGLGAGRGRPVRRTSIDRAPWGLVPDDLPLETAVEVFDVCAAAHADPRPDPGRRHRLRARRRSRREAGDGGGPRCEPAGEGGRGRRRRRSDRAASATSASATSAVVADLRDPLAALSRCRGRRGAARRPHGRRRQRDRLRAERDPAHRRGRHDPLLLDGDQLPDGGARRRRARERRPDADRQRLLPRPRPYALDLVRRTPALREALGPRRSAAPPERGPRGADALARPRRARPRQPHRRPHLPRGGARRLPQPSAGSPATSTSSAAARWSSTARSTPAWAR